MEFFKRARIVRFRSEHSNKYLVADQDEETITLNRNGIHLNACWYVESVQDKPNAIRLKSCDSMKYLGAFTVPFFPNGPATRVVLSSPGLRLDRSIQWVPIKEGSRLKLRSLAGNFLRANNAGLSSVALDVESRSSTQNWFLWAVDALEIRFESTGNVEEMQMISRSVGSKVEDQASGSSSRDQEPGCLEDRIQHSESMISTLRINNDSKRNRRWNVVALVFKIVFKLRLLLREAYKTQEEMKLHCRLFPNDYEFRRETLIELWMAAGYLSMDRMEEYGRRYFDILLNQGHIVHSRIDTFSGESKYGINVDTTDLPIKDEDLYTVLKDEQSGSEKTSYLHVCLLSDDVNQATFATLKKFSELKTLLFVRDYGPSLKQVPSDLFLALRSIEALDLSGSQITELPGSIGYVRQLRFLNLSFTLIERLPETISRLQELQTLRLIGCKQLNALPKGMKKLVNLRHLYFDVIGQLSVMPRGIGALTELRTLSAFLVDVEEVCNISELRHMNNLAGSLCICGLENATDFDAREAALHDKLHLTRLKLRWNDNCADDQGFVSVDASYLEPHPCLEELQMICYPGSKLPKWIGDEKFEQLCKITLRGCDISELDIYLGRLPNLRYLDIIRMDRVQKFDLSGDRASPRHVSFPKLEKLTIDGMFSLASWTGVQPEDFPLLAELFMRRCPKIIELPFLWFLDSLRHLELSKCTLLESLSEIQLPGELETLMVEGCPLLNQRYSKNGAEWDKIKHVPDLWFDLEEVHSHSVDGASDEHFRTDFESDEATAEDKLEYNNATSFQSPESNVRHADGVDGEDEYTISILRQQVRDDQAVCAALHSELEQERTASAAAAEEALTMILRLQEEKAVLKRTSEENIFYFTEEMFRLKKMIVKGEQEEHFLEKEYEADHGRKLMDIDDLYDEQRIRVDADSPSKQKGGSLLPEFNQDDASAALRADVDVSEIDYLKLTIKRLQERERNLEVQLLEYYGLKDQEKAVTELNDRLKKHRIEAKLSSLKIESLQEENKSLVAQVTDAKEERMLLKSKLLDKSQHYSTQTLDYKEREGKPRSQDHTNNLEAEAKELRMVSDKFIHDYLLYQRGEGQGSG